MPQARRPEASAHPHLDELAHILALGILRLRRRREAKNSNELRGIPLDFSAAKSVHGRASRRKGKRP